MMKCSKECIPICDTCAFCSLYPLAHWEINEDGYYPYCTKCGKEPQDGKMTEICPNCKARMVNSNATD